MKEEPKDIKSIFAEAIEKKSPEERAAFLDKACKGDDDLLSKVEDLLKAHSQAGDFLEVPTLDADVTLEKSTLIEGPGTMIGRYKLLELVGEGGMGLVYLAEQKKPVRRRVALKIIKPGMDSKQVIARFETERQTLALLDHPNIAKVLDAGTTESGRPYFVMEYVKGMPITEHCDQEKLSIEERLTLFIQVCESVQHAHQKGIIHRDIKPSNILVSAQDDKPIPKIIDFGVAKAVSQPLTERTLFTKQGQLLGTPEYMSPEQAQLTSQDIDTRSDIYSLGVLIYELLTGTLPFDSKMLRQAAFDEILRIIREEEPPRPSTRLSSLEEEGKKVAENRRTQLITLAKRLHKELEWIPLKAMRKERSHRYQSASELAGDIRNYLSGTPLIAGPESAAYRLKKFIRRHQALVTGLGAVLVVLVAGVIVSTIFAVGEHHARVEAQQEAEARRRALYINLIALAETRCQDGDIPGVGELLMSCPPDIRGWEWYRLWHVSNQPRMILSGHGYSIKCVAFSPDGDRIVSGAGLTIKVWHAISGIELLSLGCKGHPLSVSFSPDGKRLACASDNNIITVWDLRSGTELMTLKGHQRRINSVAFKPDGKRIVSGSADKTIKVWDAVKGFELFSFTDEHEISSVAFSPDGKRIVSGNWGKTVKIWDAESGLELMILRGHGTVVLSVAFSSDGERIASADSYAMKVWNAASGAELMDLGPHSGGTSVAFSPDGRFLISCHRDRTHGTIQMYDATTGTELMILRGHYESVNSVAFSPGGKRIVSGGYDGMVKVWNAAHADEGVSLKGYNNNALSSAFSPDGRRIVSGSRDETIKIWDVATGKELNTLRGHTKHVPSVAFNPDGSRIVSGSWDKTIKVWDAMSCNELLTLKGHDDLVTCVAFSPDGKRIISGSRDKTTKVWDAATGHELLTFRGNRYEVRLAAFSPDGGRIVSDGQRINVLDATTGAELLTFFGHGPAFSPDGRQIASVFGLDGIIKVRDSTTGSELMALHGHRGARRVAFSPDGRRIISGGSDGTIKVWDLTTRTPLMTLRGHKREIHSLGFSPDGTRLVSVSGDLRIKIWNAASLEEVEAQKEIKSRQVSPVKRYVPA